MKKLLIGISLLAVLVSSCTKNDSSSTTYNTNTLMPLKAGNTWIYQDSLFSSGSTLQETYLDTATVTNQSTTISGYTFRQYKDSLGYFGSNSLLCYDSTNYAIYQLDSINSTTPYVFFEIAPFDNDLLGTGTNISNSNCVGTYYAYGFYSTFAVNGYTCYKNIDYERDCSGNIISEDIYYIAPGVGIVRIEDYEPVSTNSSSLYLYFSQTLKSYKLY